MGKRVDMHVSPPSVTLNRVWNTHISSTAKTVPNGVAQVAHLRAFSKDVSGCSTVSCEFFRLVRNEEVGGSSPLSSTKLNRSGPET